MAPLFSLPLGGLPGPEHLCEFVATADQDLAYDLVMGALSDDAALLFPVAGAGGPADAAVEPLSSERGSGSF